MDMQRKTKEKLIKDSELILESIRFWEALVLKQLLEAEKVKDDPEKLKEIEKNVKALVLRGDFEIKNIDNFLEKSKYEKE